MIFLDTSAIYALADAADPNHKRAKMFFHQALQADEDFLVHNYVLVESTALLQNRLGFNSARRFVHESENFHIHWITHQDHQKGVDLWNKQGKRGLSLVDCVSFIVMRRNKVKRYLGFDPDFEREGFQMYRSVAD